MVVTVIGLVVAGPEPDLRLRGLALARACCCTCPSCCTARCSSTIFDELAHVWTLEHLDAGAGLFLENPINKAVEFYPGLESVAGVLVSATGISEFAAGNILIGALHALLAGALFLFYERVADSPRVALLSVMIYAANPAFVFFDSYFAYESFALPLAASALAAAVLSERMSRRTAYGLLGVSFALCLAVVVSHHATAWVLAGLLLLLGPGRPGSGAGPGASRSDWSRWAATAAVVGAWLIFVAPYTFSYVGPTFTETADAVGRFASGNTQHRQLFYRSTEPFYEKYGSYLAVFLLAGAFAYAVLVLMRREATRREHLTTPMTIVGALYFLSLPIAFLVSNNAVTRAWEFAFLGVAPLVAVALSDLLIGKRPWPRPWRRWRCSSSSSAASSAAPASSRACPGRTSPPRTPGR